MNWTGLEAYYRAIRPSSRLAAEPKPDGATFKVNSKQVGWYRANAMHLTERLPPADLDIAAEGGLQDSAPRAALLSLHARVEDVGPSVWEDPTLVQIWFRGADYVVPKAEVGIFTVGALPRDRDQAAALNDLADLVLRALDGKRRSPKEVAEELDLPNPFVIRSTCVTGKVYIRWDASTISIFPATIPEIDQEEARLELARRFLHWMGPAGPGQFAKWARISRADVSETWKALEPELLHVDFADRSRRILASDESNMRVAQQWEGVRLLPMGDPYVYLDEELLHPANRKVPPKPNSNISTRLLNSLACRILVDGELVGIWGRVQNKVTIFLWKSLSKNVVNRISSEAESFEGPIGKSIEIRWLE